MLVPERVERLMDDLGIEKWRGETLFHRGLCRFCRHLRDGFGRKAARSRAMPRPRKKSKFFSLSL